MKEILVKNATHESPATAHETFWHTLVGCVLFWAGFLTLCWVL